MVQSTRYLCMNSGHSMSLLMSILPMVLSVLHILYAVLQSYSSRRKMVSFGFVSISGALTKSPRKIITHSPTSLTSWTVLERLDSLLESISSMLTILSGFKVMSGKPPSILIMILLNGVSYPLDLPMLQPHSNIL